MTKRTAIVLDSKGTITDWNRRAEEMFGWPLPEVIGQLFTDLLRNVSRDSFIQLLEAGNAAQLTAQHKNAGEFLVEVLPSAVRLAGGLRYSLFVQTIDFEQSQAGLCARAQNLSEPPRAHDHFQRVIATARDAYVEIDAHGHITEWNRRAEQFFGWARAEVLGASLAEIVIPDRLRKAYAQAVARVLKSGGSALMHRAMNFKVVCRNRSVMPVEVIAWAVETPLGIRLCSFVRDITERKQAEQRLRTSELFNRQILNSSPDCMKVLDLQGQLLSISAGGCRTMELDSPETVVSKWWPDFWPDDGRASAIQALNSAKAGHDASFVGYCPTAKDTPKWWDVRILPIRIGSGEPERLLVISRDIIDQRESQSALEAGRERMSKALEGAQIGTWTWNILTGIVAEDESCFALFGLVKGFYLTDIPQFLDVVHPDDRDRVWQSLSDARKTGHYRAEYRVVWPDGSIHFLRASAEVTFQDSKATKMSGVTWDVTAQARAEESLRASEAKLKEAQEVAHVGHFELDLRTHALTWSDELYRIYGLPPADGITFEAFQPQIPEEDRAPMFVVFEESVATGKPRMAIHRVINTDGSVHYIESRFRVEQDCEGRSIRVLGTNLDVTAREEALLLLRNSHDELERRVEERTKLLAQSNEALLVEIDQHKLTQNLVSGQNQVLRQVAEGLPIEQVFEALVQFGEREAGNRLTAAILLKTEDGKRLRWSAGSNAPDPRKHNIPEIAIGSGNGASASAAFAGRRMITSAPEEQAAGLDAHLFSNVQGARSVVATPIVGEHNEVLGTVSFCLRRDTPTEYELRLQDACASLAAIALLRDEEQRKRRRWEEMFQHASWGMALADAHTEKLLAVNPAYAQMLGYTERELIGRSVFDLFGLRVMSQRLRQLSRFAERPHLSYQSMWKRKSGVLFPVSIDIVQINDLDGEPLYWGANVQDITDRKAARSKVNEALQQYRFMADLMPQIVWTARHDGWTDYVNQKWLSYMGMSLEQAQQWGWESIMHPDDLQGCSKAWARCVKTGAPYEIEYRLRRASDGEYRWHLARALPFRNEAKEIVKWFGTCTDVHEQRTEKQRLEAEVQTRTEQLRRSLTEKETLLKEVHHRVKNNLQVISSLLRMQAESLKDEGAVAALQDSRQRVLSMALIHERLYGKQQMDEIDFAEYTRTLVNELFYSYNHRSGTVVSRVEASCVLLNIDQAIPCGLILNELVTNALKYAYPGDHTGEVLIELEEPVAGRVRLTVSDQGVGLPKEFDSKKLKSLGLPIVDILSKQIGGTFSVDVGSGAKFTLDFPRDDSKAVKTPPAA